MGTHVLLEAAKEHGVQLFVHVSTDEVYGDGVNNDDHAMQEEHVLEPTNPYAATKAAAEFLAKSYHRSFHLPIIITRGNNVYGPHQFPEKLIPKFIHQLDRNERVTVHGTGENQRNFLYVTDVANAFDLIVHQGIVGSIYNIGGKNERTNLNVAETLIQAMKGGKGKKNKNNKKKKETLDLDAIDATKDGEGGSECGGEDEGDGKVDLAKYLSFVEDRCFNDVRYNIDSRRLRNDLKWEEKVSWEEGIQKTVDWYTAKDEHGVLIERWPSHLIAAATVAHPRMMGESGKF